MIDIEQRVRDAFARTAAPLVPAPNPMGRLLSRHRRRGIRRLVSLASVLVLALGSGGVLASGGVGLPWPDLGPEGDGYMNGDEIRSEWTRRLIESPSRGNLAGDSALVAEVTAAFRDGWYGRSATGGAGISPELERINILLLHQVGQQRQAVAVFYNNTHAAVVSVVGAADAAPAALVNGSSSASASGVQPFVILDQSSLADATVALAPAGCEIAVSASVDVDPLGVPQRRWEPVGDWTVRQGGTNQDWWQVTCDGQVRYRQFVSRYPQVEPDPAATARPLRGTAEPGAVRRAVTAWRSSGNGLGSPPTAVWGGLPAGQTQPVVVVAGAASGGGTAVLALTGDGSFPNFADGPDSRTIQGPPRTEVDTSITTGTGTSNNFLAVRLPDPAGAASDRLLVIAPPGADAIRVAGMPDPVPLVDGAAVITQPRPLDTQLDAIGNGAVVGTMRLAEPTIGPLRFGIALIDRW